MPNQKARKLDSDVAADMGWSGASRQPADAPGFGRGYNAGGMIFFVLFIGLCINFYFAMDDNAAALRAAGYILILVGAGFVWAFGYTIAVRKGIPWSTNFFGRSNSGIANHSRNPFAFWTLAAASVLVFAMLLLGGIYLCMNASRLAGK